MWRGRHSGVSAKQPRRSDRSGRRLRSSEGDEQRGAPLPGLRLGPGNGERPSALDDYRSQAVPFSVGAREACGRSLLWRAEPAKPASRPALAQPGLPRSKRSTSPALAKAAASSSRPSVKWAQPS